MKKHFWLALLLLFISTVSDAALFEMKIDHIHSVKCAQKIHDYFKRYYGQRVQNLKIDIENSKISFESISMDDIEIENIKNGLVLLNYKIMDSAKDVPKSTGTFSEETIPIADSTTAEVTQ